MRTPTIFANKLASTCEVNNGIANRRAGEDRQEQIVRH